MSYRCQASSLDLMVWHLNMAGLSGFLYKFSTVAIINKLCLLLIATCPSEQSGPLKALTCQ